MDPLPPLWGGGGQATLSQVTLTLNADMASAPIFLQDGVPSGVHMALQNHLNTLCLEMDQFGRSQ